MDCPKCSATSAWYKRDGPDLVLRCLCGYHKVVASELESADLTYVGTPINLKLPQRLSNLWFTLVVIASLELANTAEITERLEELGKVFSRSDVASYLAIMRTKGLVETTEVRRGVAGGSTWRVTEACAELLEI